MKKLLAMLMVTILVLCTACSNDATQVDDSKPERNVVKSVTGINLPNGSIQDLMQIPNKDLEGSAQMFGGILTWTLVENAEGLGLDIPYGLGESLCLLMEDHEWNYYEYDNGASMIEFTALLSNSDNMKIEFSSIPDDLKNVPYYSERPFDITGIYINNEPVPNWKTAEFLTMVYLSGAI